MASNDKITHKPGTCGGCLRFEREAERPLWGSCALSTRKPRLQSERACTTRYSPVGEPERDVPRCGVCGAPIPQEGRGKPRKICLRCEAERDMEAASSGAVRPSRASRNGGGLPTFSRDTLAPLKGKAKRPAASPLRGMSLSKVAALAHRAHMTYGQYVTRCEAEGKVI